MQSIFGRGEGMKKLRTIFCAAAFSGLVCHGGLLDFRILSFERSGTLTWANAPVPGVCTVEVAAFLAGPWRPLKSFFATNPFGFATVTPIASPGFYRLFAASIPATAQGFSNLCASYSTLRTIAGKGDIGIDGFNAWEAQFEGGWATDAELSRPHMAMGDDAGNVYIADKDAHAIRKVTPAGRIFTAAGMNEPGDDGDSAGPATRRHLVSPNGLWVRGDGTFYILDMGNGKVRKVSPGGVMTTLFKVSGGIDDGRGLWVSEDETLAYVASGASVKRWTPNGGLKTYESGFKELGNIAVDSAGRLVVTDRADHRVYRISNNGNKSVIAGNGELTGGGDGELAKDTALPGVRGIWFFPTGGYFLATHEGSQIWYVDTSGIIHLFVDGQRQAHDGDGDYFRSPGFKVSEVRAITMDREGNLLITENDVGFIRKIDFLRRLGGN